MTALPARPPARTIRAIVSLMLNFLLPFMDYVRLVVLRLFLLTPSFPTPLPTTDNYHQVSTRRTGHSTPSTLVSLLPSASLLLHLRRALSCSLLNPSPYYKLMSKVNIGKEEDAPSSCYKRLEERGNAKKSSQRRG
ncbi:hypothetical protein BC835DRAFT_288240 [Cytidiella melzeri]|nr:hypothetical protein BC835DRAFT_288240 [Cytidiella melzeri]